MTEPSRTLGFCHVVGKRVRRRSTNGFGRGGGSSVGVWGRPRPPCMHPAHPHEQFLATREPQPPHTHPAMHSHSGQPRVHAVSPSASSALGPLGLSKGRPGSKASQPHTKRQGASPGKVPPQPSQPPWEVGPSAAVEGRLGRDPARYVLGGQTGQPSARPVAALRAFSSCTWFADEPVLSTRHQHNAPKPWERAAPGPTPAPHASCVLPREGKAWDGDTTAVPSRSSLKSSEV